MTVSIGWRMGDDCAVLITEEHDGVQETTPVGLKEFLERTGLGIYFFQLKPEMVKHLRNEERKAKRAAKKKAGAA